jgi:hypothetical protein
VLDARIVDEIARGEIIRAIEHEVAACDQTLDVALMHVQDFRRDRHIAVDLFDAARARYRFRHTLARVLFGEHRLSLQVRLFDEIPIRDPQTPDARTRQRLSLRRPQRAATNDQHLRRAEPRLPLCTNAREQNLSAVTFHKIDVGCWMSDVSIRRDTNI